MSNKKDNITEQERTNYKWKRVKTKEQWNAYMREYYRKNKKDILKKRKQMPSQRDKNYYEENREERIAYQKEYYRNNKEKMIEYMREYNKRKKQDKENG